MIKIMQIVRAYLKYVMGIMIIGAFSYIFEFIYSSDNSGLLLTVFIASSLGIVLHVTK